MRRSKSPRCSDEYKRDGRATRQNRYEQTGERMRISLARSLVEWTRNEPRENVQLREWEICLRNEDRFRDDHHPTPSTPRPSYFLTRQTTRRSFISFFSPLLSFDQRPISFYTRIYLSNPWNLSNDYEPKRETSISIRESVYGFAKERRRDDPISVEEG